MNIDNPQAENIRMHLEKEYLLGPDDHWLLVDTQNQVLRVFHGHQYEHSFSVSTSSRGTGCEVDSLKTPVGVHRISHKIGHDQPAGMIFRGREPTGEIAAISHSTQPSGDDLITSRILWLRGQEHGINAGSGVDSHDRYIYIHGTNEEGCLGQPVSHGCIRMANAGVIELFDLIDADTLVVII
jgi:lipoprotein-anchoring transpeptidase ErfK/SrfK